MKKHLEFEYSAEYLSQIIELRNYDKLKEIGIEKIANGLHTDLDNGISILEKNDNFQDRILEYGVNEYPPPKIPSIIKLFFESLKDAMIIILIIMAILSICLNCSIPKPNWKEEGELPQYFGWIEGVSILLAVLIVGTVSSFNDYSKEKKFRTLYTESNKFEVKTVRYSGQDVNVFIQEILPGDVIILDTGDQVPADGVLIKGYDLKTDESSLTGETKSVPKNEENPFIFSGCRIAEGTGRMLILAVGKHSEWGKTLTRLLKKNKKKEDTPLQQKLDKLAGLIGKIGIAMAVITFIILTTGYIISKFFPMTWSPLWTNSGCDNGTIASSDNFFCGSISKDLNSILNFGIIAITIVVVAVPEGLPLAVTISLAYSVRRMLKDKNLVRHLIACETMGGATNICSDKTGTLTLNQMRVVKCVIFSKEYLEVQKLPTKDCFSDDLRNLLVEGISINSTASLLPKKENEINPNIAADKQFDIQGNKTEGSLLLFVNINLDENFKIFREKLEKDKKVIKKFSFSSKNKRMSVIISKGDGQRIYCKGAGEIILDMCKQVVNLQNEHIELTQELRDYYQERIDDFSGSGYRTLALAFKDYNVDITDKELIDNQDEMEKDLVLIGIVGIQDPLRKHVKESVEQCQRAGIFVRMVTGDNILTAKFIAKECGILSEDGIALEGPKFRQMDNDDLDEILPKLQVLARSSPDDKYKLVRRLRDLGEVVAVTGDGTNDAPALDEADGLSGTSVAKEASDIIILDDDFKSIVKSVLWGRSVFENIRKFLSFQITVNVVALLLTFISAITQFIPGERERKVPLTAIQLLWVNLIMDTFAALALATEKPEENLLERKPYGRYEALINWKMWWSICCQSFYQLFVLLFIYYVGPYIYIAHEPTYSVVLGVKYDTRKIINTMVFNAFVWCQVFNEFNCRKINFEWNIFKNVHKSFIFVFIVVLTMIVQVLIVEMGLFQIGNAIFSTTGLNWYQWMITIFFGIMCIPVNFAKTGIGILIDKEVTKWKSIYKKEKTDVELKTKTNEDV